MSPALATNQRRAPASTALGPRAPAAHVAARPRLVAAARAYALAAAAAGGAPGMAGPGRDAARGGSFTGMGPGGSGGSFTGAGLAHFGEKKRLAELVAVGEIAKGFSASRWW